MLRANRKKVANNLQKNIIRKKAIKLLLKVR